MRKLIFTVAAVLVLLTACSETPSATAKKEPAKPPEPVTGQSALFRMFQVARSWGGTDMQVLSMHSMLLEEVPNVPRGRAAAWEAIFVAPSRSQARSYTYSIIDVPPTIHKGVFAGPEQSWSGPRGNTAPFLMAAVKIDTDEVYKTALAQATEYDKKNPGKPITWLLEKNNKFPDPVWRVVWGESVGTSNFSIFVDASTGEYKEKMR